jgi:predicted short-subunit dehydrogenase-like oxidoreductase (DUF2520 family)
MNVSVVGAGRAGTAVAVLLSRAGHKIVAVSGRGPTRDRAARYLPGTAFVEPDEAARAGDLVIVAVPDDLIVEVVERLAHGGAFRSGQWVAHLSGAAGLSVLAPVRAAGARPLAVHPLQTFPDVAGGIDRIPGSFVAVTADDPEGYLIGERIAEDLMARSFRLADADRGLYHAAAVFASNYLVGVSAIAQELFALAGVPDPVRAMLPLQRASLDNVERLGPEHALTGPAVRGDAGTVDRNLAALHTSAPHVVPAYIEMCRVALELGERAGRLSAERRAGVEEVLSRWS